MSVCLPACLPACPSFFLLHTLTSPSRDMQYLPPLSTSIEHLASIPVDAPTTQAQSPRPCTGASPPRVMMMTAALHTAPRGRQQRNERQDEERLGRPSADPASAARWMHLHLPLRRSILTAPLGSRLPPSSQTHRPMAPVLRPSKSSHSSPSLLLLAMCLRCH